MATGGRGTGPFGEINVYMRLVMEGAVCEYQVYTGIHTHFNMLFKSPLGTWAYRIVNLRTAGVRSWAKVLYTLPQIDASRPVMPVLSIPPPRSPGVHFLAPLSPRGKEGCDV